MVCRENFDESLAIHQTCQSLPLSNFCIIQYVSLAHVHIHLHAYCIDHTSLPQTLYNIFLAFNT